MQREIKLTAGVILCGNFDRNEISFRERKFHVNTIRNQFT